MTETGQLSGAICDLIKQVSNLSGFGIIKKGHETCKDGLKGNKILYKLLRMVVHTNICFLQTVINCILRQWKNAGGKSRVEIICITK